MIRFVPRTCTRIPEHTPDGARPQPQPLEAFRAEPAYVLLGDPGAGKSTAFEHECTALGGQALHISARDFLTFDPSQHPRWRDRTLFIDGLDEVRAGVSDARTPFDNIRQRLDSLGKPKFRLSCRQADWFGANDRTRLAMVSAGGEVAVLQLSPLTPDDVKDILQVDPRINDPHAFIRRAEQQRIDGLLFNPQNLDLLIVAVAGDGWPNGRLATFEQACRRLVTESNQEHKEAAPSQHPDRLLAAAGKLCAHSLIAGTGGYALDPGNETQDYPDLNCCFPDNPEAGRQVTVVGNHRLPRWGNEADDPKARRQVVATRLFTADAEGRFACIHRHIAEFLGARYLGGVIEEGIPLDRVLALMTGNDGIVVTPLRGLSAWLAAHCPRVRAELIERDPTGVGLYGDIGTFSANEKHALLQSLARVSPHRILWFQAAAFAPLASGGMEDTFREILQDPRRDDQRQNLVQFALAIISEGSALPDLAPTLLRILMDDTWRPPINTSALRAFIRCYDAADKQAKLRSLLDEITANRALDPDRNMLGTLLSFLYPKKLPPAEVWDYCTESNDPERLYLGAYTQFWGSDLLDRSSDQQILELLDACVPRANQVRAAFATHSIGGALLALVARGLVASGDALTTGQLCDWLSLGQSEEAALMNEEAFKDIGAWLTARPERQKAIVLEELRRCPDSEAFYSHALGIHERLYAADPPPELATWFQEQALAWPDENPRKRRFLLEQAMATGELDFTEARKRLVNDPLLTRFLDRRQASALEAQELDQDRTPHDERRRRQQEEWTGTLRSEQSALRDNTAQPGLLHQLALRFFGYFRSFQPGEGRKRIARDVGYDLQLTKAVMSALRECPNREDIPSLDEILRLHSENQLHYLGLPCLAGLAIAEADESLNVSQWTREERWRAVALYLTFPHGDYEPEWYRHLVDKHPEDVADVQVRLAAAAMREGRDPHYNIWHLAHDPSHAQVAGLASLPLLKAFPTRYRSNRTATLDQLLWAAIQHAEPKALQDILERKISRKSMNQMQRAHWLAAGCLVAPESYRKPVENFVEEGRSEERIRHVFALFCGDDPLQTSLDDLDVATMQLLIRLGGATAGPNFWEQEGIVGDNMRISSLVHRLIQRLAEEPSPDAGSALAALLADASLSRWHRILTSTIDDQKVIRRDHSYRHPSFDQVVKTLSGGDPANPGDLAALTVDLLRELKDHMRGNENPWRRYWNEDSYQKPTVPKPENSCRDVLVEYLRNRFPVGIHVEPEGQYANEKRTDIRLTRQGQGQGFHIPVEIKKNEHRNLWSAIHSQLIKQYASDPATGGHGIYVVFWFGQDRTQPAPSGKRPACASELEERLSETLSEEERRKVTVCVIDVSGP